MKIDKEYPATHSMSTAWYIVDDEGNVGFMDYNENGPVPLGVPSMEGIDYLVWGLPDDAYPYPSHITIDLSDEQIYDIIGKPHTPEEENLWFEDCVVRIDKGQESEFLKLCEGKTISQCICISKRLGLYLFDAFDCTTDSAIKAGSPLAKMLASKMILEVYRVPYFENDDEYKNGRVVHTKEYDTCPFFIYHQPYWDQFLPQKMMVPEHPVKIEQLPENLRGRAHRIPGRFAELDTFQIAEYYPCGTMVAISDPEIKINGYAYEVFPLPDGSEAYLRIEESAEENVPMKYSQEEFERLKEEGKVEFIEEK